MQGGPVDSRHRSDSGTELSEDQRPGVADPRQAKVRTAAEQAKLHLDILFADNFFKSGVWTEEYTGKADVPSGKQFWQFDNDNSDPVRIFDNLSLELKRNGRRRPNKLGLGAETFRALKNNGAILERIKYSGSSANPATVTEKVLAELFGVKEVAVLESTYIRLHLDRTQIWILSVIRKGRAAVICDRCTAIDETFGRICLHVGYVGDGSPMPITQYPGESGTHSDLSKHSVHQI